MIYLNEHVVVLIDADNIRLDHIEKVPKLAEYYGTVDICRAYGDWGKVPLSTWREKLPPKFELIQVNRVGKNATDHFLLTDIGKILGSDPNFGKHIFIIVSSDGDFASACQQIQEEGRPVVVIGNKKMSKALRNACNKFHCLEDLDKELQQLEKHHLIPPNEVRAFWAVLQRVCIKIYNTQLDWITLAELGTQLHVYDRKYEERFGKYRLTEWLHNFNWFLEVEGQGVRKNLTYVRFSRLVMAYVEIHDGIHSNPLLNKMNIPGWVEESKTFIGQRDPVSLAQFDEVLRALNPDYETLFGGRNLSEWLKDYPNVFYISEDMVRLSPYRMTIYF